MEELLTSNLAVLPYSSKLKSSSLYFMIWYFDSLDMSRPLVFLCGTLYSNKPNDRRLILKKYINQYWRKTESDESYLHAIPLIVDLFFSEEKMNGTQLKANLLEEIISNISYKTYIFLDTISTGYELGQFTNYSYGNDNTVVFVDKEYESRPSNRIGGYINLSFKNNLIKYDCAYKMYGNERFIYFEEKNGEPTIPSQITNRLNDDNPANNSYETTFSICFTKSKDDLMKSGVFVYDYTDGIFTIEANIKNLFYYVSMVYRKYNHMIDFEKMTNGQFEDSFILFIEKVKSELMSSFISICDDKKTIRNLLNPNSKYNIRCGVIDINELIYHIVFLSGLYIEYKGGKKEYLTAETNKSRFSLNWKNEFESFWIIDNSLFKCIHKMKCGLYENSIIKKTMNIKGKKRKIICYSNNYSGHILRKFHDEVNQSFLSLLPSSDASFAYKEGMNTLSCLKKHEGNRFFCKVDIRHYFESIKYSIVSKDILMYFAFKVNSMFLNRYFVLSRTSKIYFDKVLFELFYHYSLPIGFSTSPKISDFYLFAVDEEMRNRKDVTYTRYADDILISSNSKEILEMSIVYLKELLSKKHLQINERKSIYRELNNANDSIKFLGINLVKRENGKFSYTISKKYIVETSKMIQKYIKSSTDNTLLTKIIGRVNYIKYISAESHIKLQKMVKSKMGFVPSIVNCI